MSTLTFTEQAYQHILEKLFQRDLRPGDLLDRKQIAQDLNVSLIPVSDAVQRLTHEGFLTTRRRQGTFVATPSLEDVRGQFLLREAIECQSVRLCCGEKIRSAAPHLRELAQAADAVADAGQQVWTQDFEFHSALLALTECDALIQCFQRVINLSTFHSLSLIAPFRPSTYDRHVHLLDDLCDLTPDEAEKRMRKHTRSGKEALIDPQTP